MLPTRIHGVLDYVVSIFLLASPWLLDFHQSGTATWVVIVLGGSALLYSVFTDYEAGVIKRIPMPAHLALDAVHGALLTVSPWLLGFTETTWKPHLMLGLMELGVVLLSRRRPPYRQPRQRYAAG
ncbi:MAG TPA: hypothetical protein VF039_09035 [Longimicrobiales bacterium]